LQTLSEQRPVSVGAKFRPAQTRSAPRHQHEHRVRWAYGRAVLKRRRNRKSAPPSYDAIIGQLLTQPPQVPAVSAQQVWNISVAQVNQGLNRMEEKGRHPPLNETDMHFIAENLLRAMWGFERLSEGSGDGVEPARVLAQSLRELLDGLRNEQAERVIAGFSTTSEELKKITSS
jgi:hypothetical protein